MTNEDRKYLSKLGIKRRLYAQQQKTITDLKQKITDGDTLYGIQTLAMFDNNEKIAFNLGEMGLKNQDVVDAYVVYLEVLLTILEKENQENELHIKAMNSKLQEQENVTQNTGKKLP
jgi:hypothetical protein